jgi:hypothetical protein
LNGIRWFGRLTIFVAEPLHRSPAISQSYLQRQFNELILVRVAAFGEGLEDLREKKEL